MSQVLAVKFQDKVIPEDYLTKVMAWVDEAKAKKHVVYFGMVIADKDEAGASRLSILREKLEEDTTVKSLMDIQEAYKDFPAIMHFQTAVGEIDEDKLQPFDMVTNHEDTVVCTAFVLGEYPALVKKGSTHSPQFLAATEKLRPRLEGVYDACENDIGDFADELQFKVLTRELETLGTEVCITAIVACDPGHIQGYLKDYKSFKELSWGAVSDTLVPEEKKEEVKEPEVKEPEKKLSMLERMGIKGKAAPAPAETPVKEEPVKVPGGTPDDGFDLVQCPAGMTNKEARQWYRHECGFIPEVSGNMAKLRPKVPKKKVEGMQTSRAAIEAARAHKDIEPHHIPKIATTVIRQTADQPVHILNDEEKAVLAVKNGLLKHPTVLKLLDSSNEEILPPEIIKEMEGRKTVNEILGLDGGLERWSNIPEEKMMTFSALNKKLHNQLYCETRLQLLRLTKDHLALLKKTGEEPALPTTAPATAPAQPAASPDTAPKKRDMSMFGVRKRA